MWRENEENGIGIRRGDRCRRKKAPVELFFVAIPICCGSNKALSRRPIFDLEIIRCSVRFFAAMCMVRYLLLLAHDASGGSILSLSLAGC